MKQRLGRTGLLLEVLVLCSGASHATAEPSGERSAPQAFERGIEAYRRGDYAEARARWDESLAQCVDPRDRARVYYDLGNASWRLEKPLEAIACYTAAVRLDPRREDAWKNLELARAKAGLPPADAGDLRATLVRALTSLRPPEARWLALGALCAWLLLLAAEIRLGGGFLRGTLVFAGVCALLAAGPWIYGFLRHEGRAPMFVVQVDGASLRSEPLEARDPIGALSPLSEVQRIDELPGWVRVEQADGGRGWVRAEALFPLQLQAPQGEPQAGQPLGG